MEIQKYYNKLPIIGKTSQIFYESTLFSISSAFKVAVIPHPNVNGETDANRKEMLFKQIK
ncbi:MAG: hypothetical protein UIB61_01180 [Treponema sp.]|nr:hypothetical protein [Treponema sp.]